MDFDEIKEKYLKKLEEHIKNNKVDIQVLHIIKKINSLKDYFTTSSCAGRIVLIKVPENLKKQKNVFLFKSHNVIKFEDIYSIILQNYKNIEAIWFKQEPFIFHISCRNLKSAKKILEITSNIGLKHSGIISIKKNRIIIEVVGNEKIETIISKNGKIIVDENYLKYLIEEANKKLLRNRKYLGLFYLKILDLK